MSFSISFGARSAEIARHKLASDYHYVPTAVKALIEKALDAIPVPKPEPLPSTRDTGPSQAQAGGIAKTDGYATQAVNVKIREPIFVGVFVECDGHIASPGEWQSFSFINKFVVRPLYE
jgi:hypothetical protein